MTGKDLNKALIKYLENYFCQIANQSSRYNLLTKRSSPNMTLKRAELAAMREFSDNISLLMGTIGYKMSDTEKEKENSRSLLFCKSRSGADAIGYLDYDGFVVKKDSKISPLSNSETFSKGIYSKLRDELCSKKIIVNNIFIQDYTFSSPTAAANVIMASQVSGNAQWCNESGIKLKDLNM